jgi:16S rRNA (cytosine967-C5)-methyltransferase
VLQQGAFIAAELDQHLLLNPGLDSRDVALSTELAYGVVRCRAALERRVREHAPRGVKDQRLLTHLLVATYQLCLLDRVPAFAAVNETVDLVRSLFDGRVAGFSNAVLRKVAQAGRLEREAAVRESVPPWLWDAAETALGAEQCAALFGTGAQPEEAVTCARFRAGRALPEWTEQGQPGRWLNDVRRFRRQGDLRRHAEWQQGDFVVQEEGAALCGYALGAQPGEKVLDACAGRGQKASLLAECIGPSGELWVSDNQQAKLLQLHEEFARLALPPVQLRTADWLKGNGDFPKDFDRVLVDAPCTGSGTLRHRPEIALRLKPSDVERLAARAEQILRKAATHAKPGGTVLFVVCSVLPAECEAVVQRVSSETLVPTPISAPQLLPLVPAGATQFRLLPGLHGTDGFFLAAFQRR